VKTLPYDPDRARALLAQAGYPGGRGLRPFAIYVSRGSLVASGTFDRIGADLRAVGFPCEVQEVSWQELSQRVEDHAATAFVLGWIADLADPDAFLSALFAPEATANYFAFTDERTAQLLEAGARETNPIERARAYREIERHILEMAPFVPLFHSLGVIARRKAVHGVEPGPLGLAALDLENVWIEGGR
jgi:peptide/nickel transport system substrate-binding protein